MPGAWFAVPGSDYNTSSLDEPQDKNLWLFDMDADPYEKKDVADDNPDIVKQLLDRLAEFNQTALTPYYPGNDALSAPSLNDGVWGPWIHDNDTVSQPIPDQERGRGQGAGRRPADRPNQ